MKIIWTFTLLMIPGVMSVTGYAGGDVNITCTYKTKYFQNAKYFCKGKKPERIKHQWCSQLIRTTEEEKWVHSGRFSVFDDRRSAVFTVIMRNLSLLDSGIHQCAVHRSNSKHSYSEVKLVITERKEVQTASSFTSAQTPLITSPAQDSSLAVGLSVLLLLVISLILSVILWRRRRRRKSPSLSTDSPSGRSHTAPAASDSVSPSSDSQICISSAEDVNYAAVTFLKTSDRPDSVRLRNHQECSEYAAINHRLTA
ncbi:CMRF35-like molecule 8 [Danio aesculapii]|uniref:CMRF35-like molecule 8 n=1 Tax=Danio aesculapii TaxID=1142201 RepID=UPI0024C0A3C1|nr:CMRF35-like molecule 8 [Danio aesculapii]XP_056310965.1 CMRF35-like molecule 8 [Danio aesculapii]